MRRVWDEIAECLVCANGITDVYPLAQRLIQFGEVETAVGGRSRLLGMGSPGPLHVAIELGSAAR